MQGFISSPLMFMLLVNALLLVVGCLMTTGEAILILAPLLMPVAEAYGYDKVVFGIIMILNLEIGFLTPPVGLNLIVAMSAFKQPFGLLVRSALPYIVHDAGLPGAGGLAAVDRDVPGGRQVPLSAAGRKNCPLNAVGPTLDVGPEAAWPGGPRPTSKEVRTMYSSQFPRDLFAEMERLQREMQQAFDTVSPSIRGFARGYPALNVGSTPTSVEVYAFAPGIDPAKIEVNLERGVLTIEGERAPVAARARTARPRCTSTSASRAASAAC